MSLGAVILGILVQLDGRRVGKQKTGLNSSLSSRLRIQHRADRHTYLYSMRWILLL